MNSEIKSENKNYTYRLSFCNIKDKPIKSHHINVSERGRLNYKNGCWLTGNLKTFYKGKLTFENSYKNGQMDGVQKDYTDNGHLMIEMFWKKNRLISLKKYKADGSYTPIKISQLDKMGLNQFT